MNTKKLEEIKIKYDKLTDELTCGNGNITELCRAIGEIQETVDTYNNYVAIEKNIEDCTKLLTDPELHDEAKSELVDLEKVKEELSVKLTNLLNPENELNNKDVIMEIRAGTGGEEAALFATEVYQMYKSWAINNGYSTEELSACWTDKDGLKMIAFKIIGLGVYGKLKYESGVHRVQRVPETESQGRIHTSTVTVAVLPEFKNIDVNLNEKDVRIDVFHSGGAGGQNVNKVETAIRLTHIPTGIVVQCQDERSQLKNKEKAFIELRSRLYDYYNNQAKAEYAANRKNQVGTGDRSERIRTYNFPQGRVTDHRINKSIFSLSEFLSGDINEMLDAINNDMQE